MNEMIERVDLVLTAPQRAEIKRMTEVGYSRMVAVHRLINLGIMVRNSKYEEQWIVEFLKD